MEAVASLPSSSNAGGCGGVLLPAEHLLRLRRPRALEAPEASRPPPRPSPRRSAVAEVKAAPDPVAALINGRSIHLRVLLSKNDPLTCIKLSCVISLCALPLLIFLCGEMNRLADGIFDHSENTTSHAAAPPTSSFSLGKTVEEAVDTVRRGWSDYMQQPVLPASLPALS
uniref:Solute carrier family 40 member n=1 Tax=Oryza meridionalis TaxID=40149 RepID=A0A0E0CP34_9ORYZ